MHGTGGAAADLAIGDAGTAQRDAEANGALIAKDRKAHGDMLAFHVGQVVGRDAGGGHRLIDRVATPKIDEANRQRLPLP